MRRVEAHLFYLVWDERFHRRIQRQRASLCEGPGVRLIGEHGGSWLEIHLARVVAVHRGTGGSRRSCARCTGRRWGGYRGDGCLLKFAAARGEPKNDDQQSCVPQPACASCHCFPLVRFDYSQEQPSSPQVDLSLPVAYGTKRTKSSE